MRRFRSTARIARMIAAVGVSATIVLGPPAAMSSPIARAAPAGPTMPVEFDLARYTPVDPDRYRSLAFADNGRSFFTTGTWMCQAGPQYRYIGCQGRPATAPRNALGAAIAGDQQGPWWVQPGLGEPTYRFGSTTGFRPPLLAVGQRVTIGGVTCTVPRADTVACRTGARALIFTPAWHKFYFPAWDTKAHSTNPAPPYLPPRLQYWNQLPASPPPPK